MGHLLVFLYRALLECIGDPNVENYPEVFDVHAKPCNRSSRSLKLCRHVSYIHIYGIDRGPRGIAQVASIASESGGSGSGVRGVLGKKKVLPRSQACCYHTQHYHCSYYTGIIELTMINVDFALIKYPPPPPPPPSIDLSPSRETHAIIMPEMYV